MGPDQARAEGGEKSQSYKSQSWWVHPAGCRVFGVGRCLLQIHGVFSSLLQLSRPKPSGCVATVAVCL